MDKYQKKALLLSTFFISVFYVTIVVGFGLNVFAAAFLLVSIMVFGGAFFLVNKRMKPYLNPNVYPTNQWYRSHIERNYDSILLGDEIAETDFKIEGPAACQEKYWPLFLRDQALSECFLVLKSSFSILKPCGKVVLFLRPGSLMYAREGIKDERRFYWAVSGYVFTSSKWKCMLIKIYTRIPALLLRPRDVVYAVRKCFIKNVYAYDLAKKRRKEEMFLANVNDEMYTKLEKEQGRILSEMRRFCEQRNLILEIRYNDIKRNDKGNIG